MALKVYICAALSWHICDCIHKTDKGAFAMLVRGNVKENLELQAVMNGLQGQFLLNNTCHLFHIATKKTKHIGWRHVAVRRARLDFRGFEVESPSWGLFVFVFFSCSPVFVAYNFKTRCAKRNRLCNRCKHTQRCVVTSVWEIIKTPGVADQSACRWSDVNANAVLTKQGQQEKKRDKFFNNDSYCHWLGCTMSGKNLIICNIAEICYENIEYDLPKFYCHLSSS